MRGVLKGEVVLEEEGGCVLMNKGGIVLKRNDEDEKIYRVRGADDARGEDAD